MSNENSERPEPPPPEAKETESESRLTTDAKTDQSKLQENEETNQKSNDQWGEQTNETEQSTNEDPATSESDQFGEQTNETEQSTNENTENSSQQDLGPETATQDVLYSSKPEDKLVTQQETEAVPEQEAKQEAEPEQKSEAETETETEQQAQQESEAVTEQEAQQEAEPEQKSEAEAEKQAEDEKQSEAEAEKKSEAEDEKQTKADGGDGGDGGDRVDLSKESFGERLQKFRDQYEAEKEVSNILDNSKSKEEFLSKLVDYAKKTNPDQTEKTTVLWTLGPKSKDDAAKWATENNGVTLEMTRCGMGLEGVNEKMKEKWPGASRDVWSALSSQFAAGAHGEVRVFIPEKTMVKSGANEILQPEHPNAKGGGYKEEYLTTFYSPEWNSLRDNPNVTAIYVHGPLGVSGYQTNAFLKTQ